MPLKVAIVEDRSEIAEELSRIITRAPDMELACVCRNYRSALARIPEAQPDVVIMDINLPDGSGIQATAHIKRVLPKTEVLILTIYEETDEIFKALEAGASGYLLKRSSSEELLAALRNLSKGEVPMTGEIARKVIQFFHKDKPVSASQSLDDPLTLREIEILQMAARGLAAKEIAAQCGIGVQTVNSHLRSIYDKLHVHSRMEAVNKYFG
ncbi:DNA-binding NarL/FixJ family response regulator [Ereboglobus sp. PH5-5]|uniref:response regulator transcription factor n=1 Tax=Ereboglobus sp. PH5-5 TaxID=2940529 RepID=UPI002404DA0E|nr:response regulator transcription factor [Ereboglobus sp. PH5-5]MDF9833196.1 DNA-binding NarL/FixJ family response regulator [Ereboglobus sp. PH5-5]